MRIILSAISTDFYSFRNKKPNLHKKHGSIILGSPPKGATWEGKPCYFGKSG